MKNLKNVFKVLMFTAIFSLTIVLSSCEIDREKVSVLVPTGTPSLGVADAFCNLDLIDYNIVSGSDPLVAGFTNQNYDIIVAPVNLGAKFYNTNQNFDYVLYETIVWGNYYLAANFNISSFDEIDGKTVVVFGKNSTPDVVLRTLIASKDLEVTLEYVDDVSTANSYLLTGKADIIVSAEPSLTKVKAKKDIYVFDLQNEWKVLTGSYSLPQAGIFVKKQSYEKASVKMALEKMAASVRLATKSPDKLINSAISVDDNLNTIGKETLLEAIPSCNLRLEEHNKEAIEFYFNQVIKLGIGQTVGGKLPDEGFYLQK